MPGDPPVEHIELDLPDAFGFLFDPPLGSLRYRVAYGGRGSAKSWSFARALLIHGLERPLRVLCAREFQVSIRDSVHKLLEDQVYRLGLESFYTVDRSRIYGANGTEFIFLGIKHNPHSIKSLEGIDVCWVEEAEVVSAESWKFLIPTIRKDGSEIWVTFNPGLPGDPAYTMFVDDGSGEGSHVDLAAIVRKVNWDQNPWLSDALREERERLLRKDPEAEGHIWGGLPWTRSDEQVFSGLWRVDKFKPTEDWGDPLFGADWGFSRDPTGLYRVWEYDDCLWIDQEARGIGWKNPEIRKQFRAVPGATEHVIRADNARPETIAAACQVDYEEVPVLDDETGKPTGETELAPLPALRVVAAPKWPGSIEDGVAHIRSYEAIVIHERCPGIAQEAVLYRHKVDKRTGDILPAIVDAHNHGWDAVRYALAPIIKRRVVVQVV